MINLKQVPKLSSGFRFQWEQAQDCYVLLYPEGMVQLNMTAGEILAQVDDSRSVQQIIQALEAKFDGAEGLQTDVLDFIEDALEKNWIKF
jgi:pyrroloquinoline quinone biosynthesis protein D